jgi:hypothetical protein
VRFTSVVDDDANRDETLLKTIGFVRVIRSYGMAD